MKAPNFYVPQYDNSMQRQYALEKRVWTEADFDQMGWHDCSLHAIKFDTDIHLDIDYILKWNPPDKKGLPFTYWIAPATLVYKQLGSVRISLESDIGNAFYRGVEISDIIRGASERNGVLWRIETQQGSIEIEADCYVQIIRRLPSFQYSQYIEQGERGGISFSIEPTDESDFDKAVIDRRAKDDADYELVLQKADLEVKRSQIDNDSMMLKAYLIEKRRLDQEIKRINESLKDTRFEYW